jgi:hypothetical protein
VSLEDLGNIGEFVGAVAVVVSLLYLAIQIRQNTRSLRAQAHQSITSHIAELNRTIVESAEVAAIMEQGLADPLQLSASDRRRFNAYNSARFRHYDNLFYQYRAGTLEESQWRGFDNLLRFHFQQPGISRWWGDNTPYYSDEFVEYVARIRAGLARPQLDPAADSNDLW